MKKVLFSLIALIFLAASCNKCHDNVNGEGIGGKWEKTEEYSNEMWGGQFSWKTVFTKSVILYFHENGLYSRIENPGGLTTTGSYIFTGNDGIQLANDATGEKETITYEMADKNSLQLNFNHTEGVQKERFVRRN